MTKQEKDAFIDLGFLSSLRGTDSTGLITVTKKKPRSPKISYTIEKDTNNPVVFFMQADILASIRQPTVTCLMGHSRAAVFGDVNDVNAHPYQEGKIVGMHNGVARKYTPGKWQEHNTTDSRLLFKAIDEEGLEPVLANLYGKDAYALTYLDTDQATLNIVRNDERPLFFADTKGALFWASEAYMLRLALARNNIEINNLNSLVVGELYTYDFIDMKESIRTLDLKAHEKDIWNLGSIFPKREEETKSNVLILPGTTRVPSKEQSTGYVRSWLESKHDRLNDEIPWTNITKPGFDDIPLFGKYKIRGDDRKVKWVDTSEVISVLAKGCFNCRSASDIGDDLYWLSPKIHLCSECMDLPVMASVIQNAGGVIKGEYDDDPNSYTKRYGTHGF